VPVSGATLGQIFDDADLDEVFVVLEGLGADLAEQGGLPIADRPQLTIVRAE
jgi:hypothetical protein